MGAGAPERRAFHRAGPQIRNAVAKLRREVETGVFQPENPGQLQNRLEKYVTTVRRAARIRLVK